MDLEKKNVKRPANRARKPRKGGRAKGQKNRRRRVAIKPAIDPKLTKIFSAIGVPEQTGFSPDPFQRDALSATKNADCIVTAPTGAGKTWIAEQVIRSMLSEGRKTWYASPLKALSNSIYELFSTIFGEEMTGILTGDRKENPNAPVIVGTTEILRNQLYDSMYEGKDLDTDFVIMDEAHFLGDEDRGVVWEETIIYLPKRIPILMLSATIGNPDEIAQWLSSIRDKPCRVIRETKRPVRLYPLFLHPSGTIMPLLYEPGRGKRRRLYKKVKEFLLEKHRPNLAPPHRLPPMDKILDLLEKYDLLPAIFFMKSRADCDKALELCESRSDHITPERREVLEKRMSEIVSSHPYLAKHKQVRFILDQAVAAHHSGHLPMWKKTVETLMNEGLLDAVFATSTVAAGVNFPARSVVILNSDRFNGKDFLPLTPIEFHQMTGRAGRRGKDNIGFALMLPGKFMDLEHISAVADAPPSEIRSQIKINFSMVLNLLLSHTPQQVKVLLDQSFALFQRTCRKMAEDNSLWEDFLRHLEFLQQNGFADEQGRLTGDGIWASNLRVDHPILIAEGFRKDLFPKSDPALLAALIASFVNERQAPDTPAAERMAPKKLKKALRRLKNTLAPLMDRMREKGFEPTELFLAPALTIYQWAAGMPWNIVIERAGIEEGDLANLVFRTADNLRHIATLVEIFPETATAAREGVDLILKEPIV
ncbi:MAG: ATP-dependent DNA helicase [Desulfococcus sp. 4484_241]|nr:MAG: ATP-dependent DNA helicase [Desulfococcus sp. 4484_241]